MVRIGQGIELNHAGDRDAARDVFTRVWDEIGGESGDPLYVCALAHSMADVQGDVHEELHWDLMAVVVADGLTDERATRAGVASPVAGFYPSLHLNLGECYRKLGETDAARDHLVDDGYGETIRAAVRCPVRALGRALIQATVARLPILTRSVPVRDPAAGLWSPC